MPRQTLLLVCGVAAAVVVAAAAGVVVGRVSAPPASTSPPAASATDSLDFFFQVEGYQTRNQGGQTLNLYFHYRYDDGLAVADYPNYLDLRTDAIGYLDGIDTSQNPYWEVLTETLCTRLKDGFPVSAISCQLQVRGDDRAGLPYEPGWHNAIYTIGDIAPLALTGPAEASSVPSSAPSTPSG